MKQPRASRVRQFVSVVATALWLASCAALAQERELLIVQVAPFSGPQAPSGKAIRAGIQLCFDEVNAHGGINGAKIRFRWKDDGYKPAETLRLVRETIATERPTAFIATIGTANLEALKKDGVLVAANIPMIGGVSGASSMVGSRNIYVTKATHHDEVDQLFRLMSISGMNQVAIVYQDDTFGHDVLLGAENAAKRTGVEIVARAPYERNTTNVTAAVDYVIDADPPVIYLVAVTSAAIEFIKQYRERGGAAQIYGLSVIDSSAVMAKLAPIGARGYAFGTVVPPTSARQFAIVREYQQLVARTKNPEIAERSMEGYISAKALIHALKKAANHSPGALVKAIESTRQLDLGDYLIDFSSREHTGSRFVDFAIVGSSGRVIR